MEEELETKEDEEEESFGWFGDGFNGDCVKLHPKHHR